MLMKDKVKQLMELGYSKEIIMLSLGISDKDYCKYENQIALDKNTEKHKQSNRPTKLQLLRKRYYRAYDADYRTPQQEEPKLSEEEITKITEILDTVKPKIDALPKYSKNMQLAVVSTVIKELKYIDDKTVPLDIAERLYELFPDNRKLRLGEVSTIRKVDQKRSFYFNKFSETVNRMIDKEEDPKKLQELSERLKKLFAKNKETRNFSFESKIKARITNMNKTVFDADTPTETVIEIANSLWEENYDENKTQSLITQETLAFYERRKQFVEENASNENFKRMQMPTEEGSRRQIIKQITDFIRDSEKEITDADRIYQRLLRVGQNQSVVINIIISNLISNFRFDEARKFLDEKVNSKGNTIETAIARQCRARIRNAEIADYIMKGIEASSGQIQDENKYYETIVRGIEQANISPDVIVLGKSRDGLKTITWKDVMEKQKNKNRERE